MSDPAIKLFGKTIQVAPNDDVSHEADCEQSCCDHSSNNNNCLSCSNGSVSATSLFDKNSAAGEGSTDSKLEDGPSSAVLEEQAPCEDKEPASPKSSKKKDQSETSKSEDKPLKKPDKLLPCPRCNSDDTKFCYFNNYNVNQPRYFCKNCQRYWTAGGTMRNVPVGAGRRKNKHSASNPRYIVIPDTPNGVVYPTLRANAFGLEAPLCESMTSALTIADKSSHNAPNGYPDTSLNSMGKVVNPVTQESSTSGFQGFGPPWPNPWNPPFPFPVPFYAPPPYWNCGAPWMIPPILSVDLSSPPCSSPNSPLGKHPREGGTLSSSDKEQHGEETKVKVLTPKTLRIDDPSEAAKSSIWTTLGIKHENTSSLNSGVFFRGLQSKGGQKSSAPEASSVLQANPAALSRSLSYQESAE